MLNKKCFSMVILGALAFSIEVQANMLSTQDGTCRFFYPSSKNTQGWYIKTSSADMCQNGAVNNHGEVTIYNAFSVPVDQFYGFFNGGYWTGDNSLKADIVSSGVESNDTYKVFFELPAEQGFDVQYVAQMTSHRQKDKTYGPFSFCGPFRVLINSVDFGLFKDETLMTEMIDEIAAHTRKLCPQETMIQLYGATSAEPKMDDIFFFAEIDLQTARIDVKRNDAALFEKRNAMQENAEQASDENAVLEPSQPIVMPEVNVEPRVQEDIITPVPKVVSEELMEKRQNVLDKVPHLLLFSRLHGKPVYGTAVVEIERVSGLNAQSKSPLSLKLTGSDLHVGWMVVSGDFNYEAGQRIVDMRGTVEVSSAILCEQPYCTDIE